ncbi:MAG: hypothetical protein ACLU4N_07320 [Butyricimonas faecihominis]
MEFLRGLHKDLELLFHGQRSARLKMNPALQPARGYFNIPAIECHRIICFFQQIGIDDFIDIIENENDF